MEFRLSEIEEQRAEAFTAAIKEIYGEVGTIKYIFSPAGGIGVGVEIYSEKLDVTKDITDYESW